MRRSSGWLALGLILLVIPARGEAWVRWNQAGYPPEWKKSVVVMAEDDLGGTAWRVTRIEGDVVAKGLLPKSLVGRGPHSPMPYNHELVLEGLDEPGDYTLHIGDALTARLVVARRPYDRFIAQALQHLRMVRSGSDDVPGRRRSHPGDAHAPVYLPDGDIGEGRWRPAKPVRTVDASGGWYDAGDQIKFMLNEAYTVYVLLLSYQLAPHLHPTLDGGRLPLVLEEARHGLEYLSRVYPDVDTFVIQVGDERDHNQRARLPENDPLDGQRPALCALSRVHMGAAAAALALGARTFAPLGLEREAAEWRDLAIRIHRRAQEPDVVTTAFERGEVNDFYHDPSDVDQQALAAVELFELTRDPRYLEQARRLAPPPGKDVSWSNWNALANAALAPHDPKALERLKAETLGYVEHAEGDGQPWMIPGRYAWASLHRWIGAAHAARRASLLAGGDARRDALFSAMIHYTFGRNNWGTAFLFSPDLPNSPRQIYSPLYHLLDRFPTGALSEGPANRSTHQRLRHYFEPEHRDPRFPPDNTLQRFDTEAAVYSDNAYDFMCQETTIGGQADLILLLSLVATQDHETQP